ISRMQKDSKRMLRFFQDLQEVWLLPGFKQPFSVELRSCWHRTNLFNTILALPTVTSILVDVLPDESMSNHDLSKVVLASFIEESRRQHLRQFFIIKRIGLRRAETHDQSSQECTSLIEILSPVASSFLKLEALDLGLKNHEYKYHVNDLARVLGRFSSLKTLSLSGLYKLLDFGNTNPLPPIRQVDSTNAVDMELTSAETGVLWYTSRIAKEVTCLDTIHIQDMGDEILTGVRPLTTHKWRISGWLRVIIVMDGERGIGGTLSRVTCPAFLEPEVSLETRMLLPDYTWESLTHDVMEELERNLEEPCRDKNGEASKDLLLEKLNHLREGPSDEDSGVEASRRVNSTEHKHGPAEFN
ncbi:hypothetical protein EV360DRAFT_76578, partial [Lentinula raphanica]